MAALAAKAAYVHTWLKIGKNAKTDTIGDVVLERIWNRNSNNVTRISALVQ